MAARGARTPRSSSAICYVTLRPGNDAYQEAFVQRDQHRIYVRDRTGSTAASPRLLLKWKGRPDDETYPRQG